jgi:hypothetical protein
MTERELAHPFGVVTDALAGPGSGQDAAASEGDC